MIKDLDVVKEQLKELAEVINLFKSELVQLRVLELVFRTMEATDAADSNEDDHAKQIRSRRRSGNEPRHPSNEGKPPRKKVSGRLGGKAMLDHVYGDGYFKSPRTIKQLVDHCEHNFATKYRQSDFSGALGRLTRSGKLKRTKNTDKQYEYSEV